MDDAGASAPVPELPPEPEPPPTLAPPLIDPAEEEPASREGPGEVDSALDLDAISVETEGPESLATVDADAGAEAPEPPAEEEAGDVFVFGAGQGGDYASGADGWSETAALEESPDDPDGEAITVAEGDELTIEGPEKLEW